MFYEKTPEEMRFQKRMEAMESYQQDIEALTKKREGLRVEVADLGNKAAQATRDIAQAIQSAKVKADEEANRILVTAKQDAARLKKVADDKTELANRREAEAIRLSSLVSEESKKLETAKSDFAAVQSEVLVKARSLEQLQKNLSLVEEQLTADKFNLERDKETWRFSLERSRAELKGQQEAIAKNHKELNLIQGSLSALEVKLDREKADLELAKGDLIAKRVDVDKLIEREREVTKREAMAEAKMTKAESDIVIARSDKKDAEILSAYAKRLFDDIRKKEAIINSLNIPSN